MKRLIAIAVFALVGVAIWLALEWSVSWDRIVANEQWLRDTVNQHPVAAIGIGALVYIVTSLVPGTTGKAILYGWLFGFWIALPIVSLSLTAAAVVGFAVVRTLFRDWAAQKASRIVSQINRALRRGGPANCLLTLRLLHAPYTLTNYAAGATSVNLRTFTWTTLVGMLPTNTIFVLAGSQLPTLAQFADRSLWSLVDWKLLVAGTLVALLPLAIKMCLGNWTPAPAEGAAHDSSARC